MTRWFRRLRARIHYRRFEDDLTREIEFHRAMKVAELEEHGLETNEARFRAARELGNIPRSREEARAVWLAPWLESLWRDIQYAARSLRRQPGFTLAAGLTLVLGIGLNTSFFTIFNVLALRSWPVKDPDSVVAVARRPDGNDAISRGISVAEYRFLRQETRSFLGLIAFKRAGARLANRPDAEYEFLQTSYVSANFFDALGVGMEVGRGFLPEDGVFGVPRSVAVISDRVWRSRFEADRSVVGRAVYVNGQPFTVVGVAARGFTGSHSVVRYDLWIPLPAMLLVTGNQTADAFDNPAECCAEVAGRLAPAVTRATATAELEVLSTQFRAAWKLPSRPLVLTGTATISRPGGTGGRLPVFALLLAAAFLVLLLTCSNVGNLQLARAVARRREIQIRLSLGASRSRIVRQLLTESLLLCGGAGTGAMIVAMVVPATVGRLIGGPTVPFAPDLAVFAFAFGLSVLAAAASGLAPALRATRRGVSVLPAHDHRIAGSRLRLRSLLLVAQIAISTVLLIAAGLLSRGISSAASSDLGFSIDDVLVARVVRPGEMAGEAERSSRWGTAIEALEAAGLGPVGTADVLPLEPSRLVVHVRLPGEPPSELRSVQFRPVSGQYFTVLRIPFVAGRPFNVRPDAHEVVVNETFARTFWPGGQAVGQAIVAGDVCRVVGVVKDSRVTGLSDAVEPLLHRPSDAETRALLVRGRTPDAASRVQAVLRTLQPGPGVMVTALSDNVRLSLSGPIVGMRVAWALGLLGLCITAVGVFGVFAYVVEERRKEIGIRMALGATPAQVVRLVFGVTRTATLGGLVAGFLLSLGVGRLLRSYLFGASPVDVQAYGQIALVVFVAAVLATYVPVRRAIRVDPAITLRWD